MTRRSTVVRSTKRLTASALATSVALGCGSATAPLDPFEPEISTEVDRFELQATNVVNVTTALQLAWLNTGFMADVDHSTVTTGGEATLNIKDPTGAVVYDRRLEPSLNEQTLVGQDGVWAVTLILRDFSGTVNFRIEKP